MNELIGVPQLIWVLGAVVVVSTAVWAYRHLRSYRKLFTAELARHGHTFISAETPPAFDTGPFPKVERLRRTRSASFLGIGGQWNTYRIVWYLDPHGEKRFSWARLRYEAFMLKEITWNPQIAPKHRRKMKAD